MGATVTLECDQCGRMFERRAIFLSITGPRIYCGRVCSGMGRRNGKTDEQKKSEKAAYDRVYRKKNIRRIKRNKREHFQRTYDPAKAAIERKKNMPRHVAYCRRPEYRAKKKRYDIKYHARQRYGEYGECFRLLRRLEGEVGKRMSDYDIRLQQGTLNKALKRKRELHEENRR